MNENLNDIFQDETTAVADDAINVDVVNRANNASQPYAVYPENTLGDVLEACKNKIGLADATGQLVYEFDGKTTSDPNMTIAELGVANHGKILINPNGKVA